MNIAAKAAQPRSVAGAPSLFGLHSRLSAGFKMKEEHNPKCKPRALSFLSYLKKIKMEQKFGTKRVI